MNPDWTKNHTLPTKFKSLSPRAWTRIYARTKHPLRQYIRTVSAFCCSASDFLENCSKKRGSLPWRKNPNFFINKQTPWCEFNLPGFLALSLSFQKVSAWNCQDAASQVGSEIMMPIGNQYIHNKILCLESNKGQTRTLRIFTMQSAEENDPEINQQTRWFHQSFNDWSDIVAEPKVRNYIWNQRQAILRKKGNQNKACI